MTDAIVHLGMPKTGTTSIQSALANNRPVLDRRGYRYSATFGPAGQAALSLRVLSDVYANRDEPPATDLEDRVRRMDRAVFQALDDRLAAEIASHTERIFVFSSEMLFDTLGSDEGIKALTSYFARRFERVRYVAYLRRQDRHIVSGYAQRANNGYVETFEDYLRYQLGKSTYLYHANFERLSSRVGHEAVTLRPFEKGQLRNADAARDFLALLGVEPAELIRPSEHLNPTWDTASIAFAHALGAHTPLRSGGRLAAAWQMVVPAIASLPQTWPRFALGKEDAEALLVRFADENAAVARDYLGREDGVLFAEPVEETDGSTELRIDLDRMAEISGRVIELAANRASVATIDDRDARIAFLQRRLAEANERVQMLRAYKPRGSDDA